MEVDIDLENPAVLAACEMPQWLEDIMLRSSISIRHLLDLSSRHRPIIDHEGDTTLPNDITSLFSNQVPGCEKWQLLHRSVPTLKQLFILEANIEAAVIKGHRSFLDWRYENAFIPFYLISFWSCQAQAMAARSRYAESEAWLRGLVQGRCKATAAWASEALLTFDSLGWDVYLQGSDVTPAIFATDLQSMSVVERYVFDGAGSLPAGYEDLGDGRFESTFDDEHLDDDIDDWVPLDATEDFVHSA